MPAGQQVPQNAASPANGHASVHDLFALTDEQILEIEPETQDLHPQASEAESAVISSEARNLSSSAGSQSSQSKRESSSPSAPRNDGTEASSRDSTEHGTRNTEHAVEPPPWLAAQMKDPWSGEEARELWNGVQQERQEAAAYRAAFATPEDARALKELYPGGVNEARAAAERASALDDIDRAYFGVAGGTPEQTSAAREQLAQRMLREDPAAFREMVFAGLRALEAAGNQLGVASVGAQHAAPQSSSASAHEAHAAAYAAFEKDANDDLERRVGGAIDRMLAQALPNSVRHTTGSGVGAQHAAPLQARLSAAIRQDVEAALKGDRQLSEQVAQILSGRRLDEETRNQVVRLIGERAQQLVPVAAKRVLKDWTQSTLAAHRTSSARTDAVSTRREVAPAASSPVGAQAPTRERGAERSVSTNRARPVDYRKLSDEQILDM